MVYVELSGYVGYVRCFRINVKYLSPQIHSTWITTLGLVCQEEVRFPLFCFNLIILICVGLHFYVSSLPLIFLSSTDSDQLHHEGVHQRQEGVWHAGGHLPSRVPQSHGGCSQSLEPLAHPRELCLGRARTLTSLSRCCRSTFSTRTCSPKGSWLRTTAAVGSVAR